MPRLLGCTSSGTCTTPAITLPSGTSNSWYVEAQDSTGNGTWSSGLSYTVSGTQVPSAPTNLNPVAGSTVSTSQVFSWAASTGATQYEFWIDGVVLQTYSATSLGCASGGTCSTPPIALATGTSNSWYVEAQNSAGDGNWSSGASYTVK